jgi:antitoxin MazE6
MKIALSVPDELFEAAEIVGKRLGLTRSRLYATALEEFLSKHRGRKVTDRLNAVYGTQESRVAPGVRRLQRRSIERDAW